jgi:hypothetical protein
VLATQTPFSSAPQVNCGPTPQLSWQAPEQQCPEQQSLSREQPWVFLAQQLLLVEQAPLSIRHSSHSRQPSVGSWGFAGLQQPPGPSSPGAIVPACKFKGVLVVVVQKAKIINPIPAP